MNDVYAVIGFRWTQKDGRWRLRKHFHCVGSDKLAAFEIAQYLNNTQTKYEYKVDVIPQYASLDEYIYYEV